MLEERNIRAVKQTSRGAVTIMLTRTSARDTAFLKKYNIIIDDPDYESKIGGKPVKPVAKIERTGFSQTENIEAPQEAAVYDAPSEFAAVVEEKPTKTRSPRKQR